MKFPHDTCSTSCWQVSFLDDLFIIISIAHSSLFTCFICKENLHILHVHLLVPYAKKNLHMIHVNLLIGKYQVLIILLLSLTQLLLVHSFLVSYAKKKFLYDTCSFACWQVSIAYCSLIA